jgi:hypothetical protein
LPISARFDCSDALRRMAAPGRRDAGLARPPRPAGLVRRLIHDPAERLLFTVALVAALAGSAIAFG